MCVDDCFYQPNKATVGCKVLYSTLPSRNQEGLFPPLSPVGFFNLPSQQLWVYTDYNSLVFRPEFLDMLQVELVDG